MTSIMNPLYKDGKKRKNYGTSKAPTISGKKAMPTSKRAKTPSKPATKTKTVKKTSSNNTKYNNPKGNSQAIALSRLKKSTKAPTEKKTVAKKPMVKKASTKKTPQSKSTPSYNRLLNRNVTKSKTTNKGVINKSKRQYNSIAEVQKRKVDARNKRNKIIKRKVDKYYQAKDQVQKRKVDAINKRNKKRTPVKKVPPYMGFSLKKMFDNAGGNIPRLIKQLEKKEKQNNKK